MKVKIIWMRSVLVVANTFGAAVAQEDGDSLNPRLSPDQVENQQVMDRKANPLYESQLLAPVVDARDAFAEKSGLAMSLDYTAMFMGISDSNAGADQGAGSGMVRFYGAWKLVDQDGPNTGVLNFKFEHRHKYTDTPVGAGGATGLGLAGNGGYYGLYEPPFSDQGFRMTILHWKQNFLDGKATAIAGWIDVTDYIDVYLLASPWTGFNNFVFSTGSAAMDLPTDAALGAGAGGMVSENLYFQAGVVDAQSDPTDPLDGFDTFFTENKYFSWAELGWTPGRDKIYFDNAHVTFWNKDNVGGNPDGWGLNASYQRWLNDQWLPFVRGGYTKDSGSLLETSLSVGVGYQPVPMRGVIGAGFNWGKPNLGGADDQYTTELFWRYQFTKELAVTPSLQYMANPTLNPNDDHLFAFGLRVRVVL
jgi:porin